MSPFLCFNLTPLKARVYLFLMIDQIPPASVKIAPDNSALTDSVRRPFIMKIPPRKVRACLTVPKNCSFVMFLLFFYYKGSVRLSPNLSVFLERRRKSSRVRSQLTSCSCDCDTIDELVNTSWEVNNNINDTCIIFKNFSSVI